MVSIIIPMYNAELYLDECIQSAINQTYSNKEILIIDDGSADNSLKIAKSYESELVKVFSQKNKGASAARNVGLKYANGKYIQFLDADDIISSDKIKIQVEQLEKNNKVSLAYCPTVYFYTGENHLEKQWEAYDRGFLGYSSDPTKFIINLWGGYTGNAYMVQPNSWLTPRNLIELAGKWDESLTLDDDGEFFSRVILKSQNLIFTKNAINYYRKHKKPNNLSSNSAENSYRSLLKASISKKEILLKQSNLFEAKVAIYKMLTLVCMETYISYRHLYRIALDERPKIQYPYLIICGGKAITKTISKFMGWRCAKIFQLLVKKLMLQQLVQK